jgi:CRISPR-associated protein Csd1
MTVLQALNGYYDRMAARGEAEPSGYSREKIAFALVLSAEGEPVQVLDLRQPSGKGKKLTPQLLEVPATVKRTSGIKPNLLWDKTAYVLGRTAGASRRTAEEHAAFKAANLELVAGSNDGGLIAFRRFLETWRPEQFDQPPFTTEMLDANFVFALDGERGWLHEREAARRLLDTRQEDDSPRRVCLVTGIEAPVARLHRDIKGVWGAQSSGAALVSFNLDAFTSYGNVQGDNAPTSEAAKDRYGAALNRMLDRGSRNRLPRPLGDATVVFWADTSETVDEEAASAAEKAWADFNEPPDDADEAARVGDALKMLAEGRPVEDLKLGLEPGTRFHILGLSPNAARLSVRYWLSDDFDVFAKRLAEHHRDLHIEPEPWRKLPSVNFLLAQTTAVQGKFDNIPHGLAGEVMRAILTGTPYPRTWLAAVLMRLRAGDDPSTGWHAAALKACINRTKGEEPLPVTLDAETENTAYQLGRLFAVIERAQQEALGYDLNTTVADRFYGAASSTPARVFGSLMDGVRTHISAAKKLNKGYWIDGVLDEIFSKLPPEIPKSLSIEDQCRFAVGYYHQRATKQTKSGASKDGGAQNTGEED